MKHAIKTRTKNLAAASIGSIQTKKKAAAARMNGRLGGRPHGRGGALAALKAMRGVLKGKIPDPVQWQREIRKEWERPLPKLKI